MLGPPASPPAYSLTTTYCFDKVIWSLTGPARTPAVPAPVRNYTRVELSKRLEASTLYWSLRRLSA